MKKTEIGTTVLPIPVLKLDNKVLSGIYGVAKNRFLNDTQNPRMDGSSHVTLCWLHATLSFLKKEGYDIPELELK